MQLYVVTDIFSEPDETLDVWAPMAGALPITRLALNVLSGRPDLEGKALHRHLF